MHSGAMPWSGAMPSCKPGIIVLLALSLLRRMDAAFNIAWYHAVPDSSYVCFFTAYNESGFSSGHGPVAFKGVTFSQFSRIVGPMYVDIRPGTAGETCSYIGDSLIGGPVVVDGSSFDNYNRDNYNILGYAPHPDGGVMLSQPPPAVSLSASESGIMVLNFGVGLTCDMQVHVGGNDYVYQNLEYTGSLFRTADASGNLHLAYTCQELGWGGSLKIDGALTGSGPLCGGKATAFVLVGTSPCHPGDSFAPEVLVVPGVQASALCYPNSVASATVRVQTNPWTCPPSPTSSTTTTTIASEPTSAATCGIGILSAIAVAIVFAGGIR